MQTNRKVAQVLEARLLQVEGTRSWWLWRNGFCPDRHEEWMDRLTPGLAEPQASLEPTAKASLFHMGRKDKAAAT